MSFGATAPPVELEGDYSSYALKWKQAYASGEYDWNQILRIDETLDKIFLINEWSITVTERTLSDGASPAVTSIIGPEASYGGYAPGWSVLRKYFAYVINDSGTPKLKIYKDGALLQTIDLSASPLSWSHTSNYFVSISPDGKYIFVDNTGAEEYALFLGS